MKLHYGSIVLIAFLGGLFGGWISSKFLTEEMAFATVNGIEFKQRQIYAGKIIAEEFFLHEKREVDALDGKIPVARAVLTTRPDGTPKLIMQDKNSNPRLIVSLTDEEGANIMFFNEKGAQKIIMAETKIHEQQKAGPALAILDDHGEICAQLGAKRPHGDPFLCLKDRPDAGKKAGRRILLSLEGEDQAKISLQNEKHSQAAELFMGTAGTRFALKDANGRIRTELGNTELAFGTDGVLEKYSGNAFPVERRSLSSLVLYDENGKVVWTAP